MKFRLIHVAIAAGIVAGLHAADEETPHTSMKEVLKARISEDAKKADAKKGVPPAASGKATAPAPAPTATASSTAPAPIAPPANADKVSAATPAPPAKAEQPATKSAAPLAKENATVLPKVEVTKGRITVLDQKIAKQEEDIARERKNLKSSEVDLALNDSKIAQPMAIFGGESSQFRKRVASERVELMETEKSLLEAMKLARTKEEKQELQKQLDEIKVMRRDLEKTLR